VLSIGHKQLPSFQRVISRPFPAKRYRGSNRQNLVFMRPPDAGKDFRVRFNTVWSRYCRVLVSFSFYTSTDSGIKHHDCAFVSVLWEYDKHPPRASAKLCWICLNISSYSNFRCFAQSGSWSAVPASFMNAGLIIRCFTCSPWNRFSERCLSYQLATQNDSILHAAARGGFCRRCIRYKRGGRWRKQMVVYQHVGLELVARTRREMKKPSLLSCLF
jgi:hypothetical protein